jgi:hypothetical protein
MQHAIIFNMKTEFVVLLRAAHSASLHPDIHKIYPPVLNIQDKVYQHYILVKKYNSGQYSVPNNPNNAQATLEIVLQINNVHHLLELSYPTYSRFLNSGAASSPNTFILRPIRILCPVLIVDICLKSPRKFPAT